MEKKNFFFFLKEFYLRFEIVRQFVASCAEEISFHYWSTIVKWISLSKTTGYFLSQSLPAHHIEMTHLQTERRRRLPSSLPWTTHTHIFFFLYLSFFKRARRFIFILFFFFHGVFWKCIRVQPFTGCCCCCCLIRNYRLTGRGWKLYFGIMLLLFFPSPSLLASSSSSSFFTGFLFFFRVIHMNTSAAAAAAVQGVVHNDHLTGRVEKKKKKKNKARHRLA